MLAKIQQSFPGYGCCLFISGATLYPWQYISVVKQADSVPADAQHTCVQEVSTGRLGIDLANEMIL